MDNFTTITLLCAGLTVYFLYSVSKKQTANIKSSVDSKYRQPGLGIGSDSDTEPDSEDESDMHIQNTTDNKQMPPKSKTTKNLQDKRM
jgi:hypothetical protein